MFFFFLVGVTNNGRMDPPEPTSTASKHRFIHTQTQTQTHTVFTNHICLMGML